VVDDPHHLGTQPAERVIRSKRDGGHAQQVAAVLEALRSGEQAEDLASLDDGPNVLRGEIGDPGPQDVVQGRRDVEDGVRQDGQLCGGVPAVKIPGGVGLERPRRLGQGAGLFPALADCEEVEHVPCRQVGNGFDPIDRRAAQVACAQVERGKSPGDGTVEPERHAVGGRQIPQFAVRQDDRSLVRRDHVHSPLQRGADAREPGLPAAVQVNR